MRAEPEGTIESRLETQRSSQKQEPMINAKSLGEIHELKPSFENHTPVMTRMVPNTMPGTQ